MVSFKSQEHLSLELPFVCLDENLLVSAKPASIKRNNHYKKNPFLFLSFPFEKMSVQPIFFFDCDNCLYVTYSVTETRYIFPIWLTLNLYE